MAKFVFIYHGGANKPQSPEQMAQVMQEWKAWFDSMGDAVVDMGHPVGQSSMVNSDGSVTDNGGSNPASGYTLVQGDTLEAVLTLAKASPILASGGSIEVAQAMEMLP